MNKHIKLVKCDYNKDSRDHNFSADYYCSDCKLKLCKNCLNEHNNSNKNHKIEELSEIAIKCDLEIDYLSKIKEYLDKCNFLEFGIGKCINFRTIIGFFDKKVNTLTNAMKKFVETIKPYEKNMKEIEDEAPNIEKELKKILEDPIYIKEYKRKNIRKNLVTLLYIRQEITEMFLIMDNLIAFFKKINKDFNEEANKLTDNDILLKLKEQENLLKNNISPTKYVKNSINKFISNNQVYKDNTNQISSIEKSRQVKSNNVMNNNINNINQINNSNNNNKTINTTNNIQINDNPINENNKSIKENENTIKNKNICEKKSMQDTRYNSTISLEEDQNSNKTNTKSNKEIKTHNNINIASNLKKFNRKIQLYNSKNKIEETKNNENMNDNIIKESDEQKNEIDLLFNQSPTIFKKHVLFSLSSNDEENHLVALYSSLKKNCYSINQIENKNLNYPQNFDKNYLNEFPYINSKIINLQKYSIIIGGKRKIDTVEGNKLCYKLKYNFEKDCVNIFPFPNTKYKHQEHCIIYCQNYNSIIVLSGHQQNMCEYFCLDGNNEWKKFPRLPTPRKNAICFLFNEKYIFIFGGKLIEDKNNQDYNVIDLEKVMKNKFELWKTINMNNNENFFNVCKLFHPGLINMDKVIYILGGGKSHNIWKLKFKEIEKDFKPEYYKNFFGKEKTIEINSIEPCNNIKKLIRSDMNDLMLENCLKFIGDEKFYKFDKKYININFGGGVKYILEEDLKKYS